MIHYPWINGKGKYDLTGERKRTKKKVNVGGAVSGIEKGDDITK